jgi:hypothetical protein
MQAEVQERLNNYDFKEAKQKIREYKEKMREE